MNRQLSNAVRGDVFSFNANLRTTFGLLSTGYIIVDYVDGNNILIKGYNINSGIPSGSIAGTRVVGLTDQNTTFVENIPQGPVAMAAGKRKSRRTRRSKRFRKSRRRR